jgi:hypothetical protein
MRIMRNHKAFSRQLLYYSPRFLLTLFALIILLLLTPIGRANADIGPKPNMDFTFEFPGDEIPITGGKLLRCDDKNCSTYSEFHGSLVCTKNNCNSWISGAYMEDYGEYNKLIISFSDKVRESNVFSKHGFGAKYTVLVNEDGLVVEQRPSISYLDPYLVILFTTALILTLLTETVVASIYIWIVKIKWRSLVWVVVANILSLSLVWFVITQFFPNNVLIT